MKKNTGVAISHITYTPRSSTSSNTVCSKTINIIINTLKLFIFFDMVDVMA